MVRVKKENIYVAMQMYSDRLQQLAETMTRITAQFEKKVGQIQDEVDSIREASAILEALNK